MKDLRQYILESSTENYYYEGALFKDILTGQYGTKTPEHPEKYFYYPIKDVKELSEDDYKKFLDDDETTYKLELITGRYNMVLVYNEKTGDEVFNFDVLDMDLWSKNMKQFEADTTYEEFHKNIK